MQWRGSAGSEGDYCIRGAEGGVQQPYPHQPPAEGDRPLAGAAGHPAPAPASGALQPRRLRRAVPAGLPALRGDSGLVTSYHPLITF